MAAARGLIAPNSNFLLVETCMPATHHDPSLAFNTNPPKPCSLPANCHGLFFPWASLGARTENPPSHVAQMRPERSDERALIYPPASCLASTLSVEPSACSAPRPMAPSAIQTVPAPSMQRPRRCLPMIHAPLISSILAPS